MEPAKSREIAMMAAKLPSQALPQSIEAAKLSIISISTRLWQREYTSAAIADGAPHALSSGHLGGIGLDLMRAGQLFAAL